jgi:hypothetical protein
LTCYFSACLPGVAVCLALGAGLGVLYADGIGDALVGGVSLTVNAVRVDLQQDPGPVPGRGATSVADTREFRYSVPRGCVREFPVERIWRVARMARLGGADKVLSDPVACGLDRSGPSVEMLFDEYLAGEGCPGPRGVTHSPGFTRPD